LPPLASQRDVRASPGRRENWLKSTSTVARWPRRVLSHVPSRCGIRLHRVTRNWAVVVVMASFLVSSCDSNSSKSSTQDTTGTNPVATTIFGAPVTGTASDQQGNSVAVSLAVGRAEPADQAAQAVQACVLPLNDMGTGLDHSVAIPLRLTAEVTSSVAVDLVVHLNGVKGLTDGGGVTLPDQSLLWAVKYSDIPTECQGPTDSGSNGTVHWSASVATPHAAKSWSTWLILAGGVTPNDPTGQLAAGKIVIRPFVQLAGGLADFEFGRVANQSLVQCSANDPAIGNVSYDPVNPVEARVHGCHATSDQQQDPPVDAVTIRDHVCIQAYPEGNQHTQGKVTVWDRQLSLRQVCDGSFGAPEGLILSAPMRCALIAAAATYGGPVGLTVAHRLCDATEVSNAYLSKDWLGYSRDKGCEYFSEIFGGTVGGIVAGAASGTGPGAVAVGVGTYKALASGLKIACGGLLDGGAKALGHYLETRHETEVAADVTNRGLCIAENRTHGTNFGAVPCPKH
jgi:hypothetical protein